MTTRHSNAATLAPPLRSQLLETDPELHDLVAEFVDGLEQRIAELRAALQKSDWESLGTLSHRIKGAGGSYGYPAISQLGALMETAARAKMPEPFPTWLSELSQLNAAARQGLEDFSTNAP